MHDRPDTIGGLRESGWTSRSVKAELRQNIVAKLKADEQLFAGIMGYSETVIPQLEHALLAGHDLVFLGERGQAKTRMIRSLVELLDEWMPIVAGSEINDDPFNPVSRYALDLVADNGDSTAISWVNRRDRFGEKLATPDTSIADLIGEVDPIKVAEGRYLSDELTLHYGLVPRTNRGIFAINELPDLAERIQVGLLNVLEERDVQIRGYKVRLPLDVMLVASANPEDYTNRGRMITPLKDRFGAQIRTHYPLELSTEIEIADQEANIQGAGFELKIPGFMKELIARFSHLARVSPLVNQRSGVSVRLTVANLETLAAAATRRALLAGGGDALVIPRICDLDALFASSAGKIEIDTLEQDRDAEVIDKLLMAAVLDTFKATVPSAIIPKVIAAFETGNSETVSTETGNSESPGDNAAENERAGAEGVIFDVGQDVAVSAYGEMLKKVPALSIPVTQLVGEDADSASVASAVEFILEGLHLSKRLNKQSSGRQISYRGRGR